MSQGQVPEVRVVSHQRCRIGENPLWHAEEKRLYWVDIPLGRLYRVDAAGGGNAELLRDGSHDASWLGGFTIEADGALLLFLKGGRVERWVHGKSEMVIEAIEAQVGMRYNDVIADKAGRVFCGTVSVPEVGKPGGLYRLNSDAELTQVVGDVLCSNGMAFTGDGKHMFYTDSNRRVIWKFDYDAKDGSLSNQREWVRTREEDGVPDGMTIDAEDHVWSAQWDGGCVIRYTPEGVEERRIALPTGKISSMTFGGEGLGTMFLTSAGGEADAAKDPMAGAVFALEPGVRGRAEFASRIGVEHKWQRHGDGELE